MVAMDIGDPSDNDGGGHTSNDTTYKKLTIYHRRYHSMHETASENGEDSEDWSADSVVVDGVEDGDFQEKVKPSSCHQSLNEANYGKL